MWALGEGRINGWRWRLGETNEFPTPRPVFWTVLPALSTAPPAKEPAAATPDWMPREMKFSFGAMVGCRFLSGYRYGMVEVELG